MVHQNSDFFRIRCLGNSQICSCLRHRYLAILSAVKNSFNALKTRLTHKASKSGHVNKPFFDVDVKLRVPSIMMDPTLEEVQAAINRCALHVLRCSKKLYMWGVDRNDPNASTETFHGLITTDKEIVKAVLLMTGSVEGTKTQVETYLSTWKKYDPLWLDDRQKAYEVFMQSKPDLDTFSIEIQKYMDTALEIDDLPSVKNIGCMALGTLPLKNALKSEVTQWKIVYARNLHQQVLFPGMAKPWNPLVVRRLMVGRRPLSSKRCWNTCATR